MLWKIGQRSAVHPFKASVVHVSKSTQKEESVIGYGVLHYYPQLGYEYDVHHVKFMTFKRLCTTVASTSDSERAPTQWAYESSEFDDSDSEENEIDEGIAMQHKSNGEVMSDSEIRQMQLKSRVEKTEFQIAAISTKIQLLMENIFSPNDSHRRGKAEEVRDYLSIGLLREIQKSILQTANKHAEDKTKIGQGKRRFGPLIQSFLKASTPCSFETFIFMANDTKTNLLGNLLHQPTFFPSVPNAHGLNSQGKVHRILYQSLAGISMFLGIVSEDAKCEILWHESNDKARMIGTFVRDTSITGKEHKAFIIPGRCALDVELLNSKDETVEAGSAPQITLCSVKNTELTEHGSRFRHMFVKERRNFSKEFAIRAESEDGDADPYSTLSITWEPIPSLKRKFALLLTPNDVLGNITVSLSTVTFLTKHTKTNVEKILKKKEKNKLVSI